MAKLSNPGETKTSEGSVIMYSSGTLDLDFLVQCFSLSLKFST